MEAEVEAGLWNASWTAAAEAAVAENDTTGFRWAAWQQKTEQSAAGLREYATSLALRAHDIVELINASDHAAEAEGLSFLFLPLEKQNALCIFF